MLKKKLQQTSERSADPDDQISKVIFLWFFSQMTEQNSSFFRNNGHGSRPSIQLLIILSTNQNQQFNDELNCPHLPANTLEFNIFHVLGIVYRWNFTEFKEFCIPSTMISVSSIMSLYSFIQVSTGFPDHRSWNEVQLPSHFHSAITGNVDKICLIRGKTEYLPVKLSWWIQ